MLSLRHPYFRKPTNLLRYGRAIYQRGHHYTEIIGFLDATCRRLARPTYCQACVYNGHKGWHCIKWQHIVLPDGLVADQSGPYEGRHTDVWMWNRAETAQTMQTFFRVPMVGENVGAHTPLEGPVGTLDPHGRLQYRLYADGGYPVTHPAVVTPLSRDFPPLSEEELAYNAALTHCRVAVEWEFNNVVQLFPWLDVHKQQK